MKKIRSAILHHEPIKFNISFANVRVRVFHERTQTNIVFVKIKKKSTNRVFQWWVYSTQRCYASICRVRKLNFLKKLRIKKNWINVREQIANCSCSWVDENKRTRTNTKKTIRTRTVRELFVSSFNVLASW